MIHSGIGKIQEIGDKTYIVTSRGQIGYAIYGPYETYNPGHYKVTFNLSVDEHDLNLCNEYDICCIIDVCSDCGLRILAKKTVVVSRIYKDKSATLDFEIDCATELEFRVYVTGKVGIIAEYDREISLRKRHELDFSPILKSGELCNDPFFIQYFEQFKDLFEQGADVYPSDNGTMVSFFGVSFYVRTPEVFQLIYEIFIINEYNFILPGTVCMVDIGMNIGLTSLYYSRLPYIKEIYSYEPFSIPFQRAKENFDLNSSFSGKIVANNYGLGDGSKMVLVYSDDKSTIGTSIKGTQEGRPEKIEIRDAAEVFERLISGAKQRNLSVAVKMDCEGSEFPIFERLEANGLIRDISVFIIEWHKWWSVDKTQHDIISHLLRNNFVVFDHTNPQNHCAGMLYAVRQHMGIVTD